MLRKKACVCIHWCVHTLVCAYTGVCIHWCEAMCICVFACMRAFVHACRRACVRVRTRAYGAYTDESLPGLLGPPTSDSTLASSSALPLRLASRAPPLVLASSGGIGTSRGQLRSAVCSTTHIHACVHTCMHMRIHTCTHARTHTCMCMDGRVLPRRSRVAMSGGSTDSAVQSWRPVWVICWNVYVVSVLGLRLIGFGSVWCKGRSFEGSRMPRCGCSTSAQDAKI